MGTWYAATNAAVSARVASMAATATDSPTTGSAAAQATRAAWVAGRQQLRVLQRRQPGEVAQGRQRHRSCLQWSAMAWSAAIGPPILADVSLQDVTIATIGTGVMAESMITGLLKAREVDPAHVVASHPRAERREHLAREHGIRTVESNREAVEGADIIVLGIKPQMIKRVGAELATVLRPEQLVISIIAGATSAALTNVLHHRAIVRSMPNTPAQLGKGMTVWYATPEVTARQREHAAALLRSLGAQIEVEDEKFVAMATAVSGTGPAYVFLVMEALIDAAVHLGFPRHIAHDLVIETLEGSTLFAKASGMHPAQLRNMVTSPGGTSAAAIHELERGRLRTVLSEAVWAAYRRTDELGHQLEAETAERMPTDASGHPTGTHHAD